MRKKIDFTPYLLLLRIVIKYYNDNIIIFEKEELPLTEERLLRKDNRRFFVEIRMVFLMIAIEQGFDAEDLTTFLGKHRTLIYHTTKTFQDLIVTDKIFRNNYETIKKLCENGN